MSYTHGTYGGYQQHRKRGEEACTLCRDAAATYARNYRKRTGPHPDRERNSAYARALGRLREEHPDTFAAYYREELTKIPVQRVAS